MIEAITNYKERIKFALLESQLEKNSFEIWSNKENTQFRVFSKIDMEESNFENQLMKIIIQELDGKLFINIEKNDKSFDFDYFKKNLKSIFKDKNIDIRMV